MFEHSKDVLICPTPSVVLLLTLYNYGSWFCSLQKALDNFSSKFFYSRSIFLDLIEFLRCHSSVKTN